MKLEDFLQTIQYRISSGASYVLESFGEICRLFHFVDKQENTVGSFLLNSQQKIIIIEVRERKENLFYRWVDKKYLSSITQEEEIYLDKKETYYLIEVEADILEKVKSIVNNEVVDQRVIVELDLDDDMIEVLTKAAEIKGITIDQFVEEALKEMTENLTKDSL